LAVLRIPTMWWIILSGALHNFNMYALGHFLSPLLIREYGLRLDQANWICGLTYGLAGGLGVLVGGWLCDRAVRRRIAGRLQVAAAAFVIATPCLFMALQQSRDDIWAFAGWLLPACLCLYVYYSGVYATIQDIVEPGLRGTAMSLYFCAMYFLGAALGPWATGRTSDYFARRAVEVLHEDGRQAIATGLHQAMYLTVVLSAVLVLVLLAASWTVQSDYEKLQNWMKSRTEGAEPAH
jgi:MFS family permease